MPAFPSFSFIFFTLISFFIFDNSFSIAPSPSADDQHTFYALITPIVEGVQYQAQLRCLEGCRDRPDILHSMVTERKGAKMGIVAFDLSPLKSRAQKAKPIRKVALKIWSLHDIRSKQRFHSWKVKAKDKDAGLALGSTIYHFQFGHFKPSKEEGIFLRLKFNHSFGEPKKQLKYALIARGRDGRMLVAEKKEMTKEELTAGNEFVLQLNDAAVGKYLEDFQRPSIYLAVQQMPDCGSCLEVKNEPVGILPGCGHYSHESCMQNLKKVAIEAGKPSINCPQCRAELKTSVKRYTNRFSYKKAWDVVLAMPILQNGNKPHYTYSFNLKTTFWRTIKQKIKKLKGEFTALLKNDYEEIKRLEGQSVEQAVADFLRDEVVKTLKTKAEEAAGPPPESIIQHAPQATEGSIQENDADALERRNSWDRALLETFNPGVQLPPRLPQSSRPREVPVPYGMPAQDQPRHIPAPQNGHELGGNAENGDGFQAYNAADWDNAVEHNAGGDGHSGGHFNGFYGGHHNSGSAYPIPMMDPAHHEEGGFFASIGRLFSNLLPAPEEDYNDPHNHHPPPQMHFMPMPMNGGPPPYPYPYHHGMPPFPHPPPPPEQYHMQGY